MDPETRHTAQTAAHAGRGASRKRRRGATADGRAPAHHNRHAAAGALQIRRTRRVVGAALRHGARAGGGVGEGRDNVREAEVLVRHEAGGGGAGRAVGGGRGAGADVARRAAGRGVLGVERARLAAGAADAAEGRALVGAAVGARDAAGGLSGEQGLDGGGVVSPDGCGGFGWEEGLWLCAGKGGGEGGEEKGESEDRCGKEMSSAHLEWNIS